MNTDTPTYTELWDALPPRCQQILYVMTRRRRPEPWTTTDVQQAAARAGHNVTRDTIAKWLRHMTAPHVTDAKDLQPGDVLIARQGKTRDGEHQWTPAEVAWAMTGAVFGPGTATPDAAGNYRCVGERHKTGTPWNGQVTYEFHLIPDGREPTADFCPITCGQADNTGIVYPGAFEQRQPTCKACIAALHAQVTP
jgi:hypothetical protein